MEKPPADIAIVGAGAAGLTAAIFAGGAARARGFLPRLLLLDGARRPGAKILVSGGGRCNVTNARVTPEDYAGGPRPIIRGVLKSFGVEAVLEWMRELGVELALEPGGKYFPATNCAKTVLEALLGAAARAGAELRPGLRVEAIRPAPPEGFDLELRATPHAPGGGGATECETLRARRVILATGGLSLPKSGSDGAGIELARRLGHSILPTTPALVPLLLGAPPGGGSGGSLAEFSGLTFEARLRVLAADGRRLAETTGPLLFTHFGVSGPAALDISRHWLRARLESPGAPPTLALGHPRFAAPEEADAWLRGEAARHPRRAIATALAELWPERFARAIARGAGAEGAFAEFPRARRLELARRLAALPLDVTGDRGYAFAETTAGGVDLREIEPRRMKSRIQKHLYLCGEMLDVDGRIGGFNFHWAWASGRLAGLAAAASL